MSQLLSDSAATKVAAFVGAAGGRAWFVGGCLRDELLRRTSQDLDIVVPEGGIRLARAVAKEFGGAFFILDAERDAGRAILRDAKGQPLDVDVVRMRAPEIVDDLALRDFTVNAMAREIGSAGGNPAILDPFGGGDDLRNGVLRAVTEHTFRDDPLRMLRGVRHIAELGFHFEEATFGLIRRDAPLLSATAAERVRDELTRVIVSPGAWQHLRLMASLGLLEPVLPESAAQIGVSQSPPHYQDVFDHTRSVLAHLQAIHALLWPESGYTRPSALHDDPTVIAGASQWDEVHRVLEPYTGDLHGHLLQPLGGSRTRRDWLWWAALAHDWGKPGTRSVDEEDRIRFFEHDHWGAELVRARGGSLRLASDEIAYVARIVELHMRPGYMAHDYPPSRRAQYHFFRDAAGTGPELTLLGLADHLATRAASPDSEQWQRRLDTTAVLLRAFFRDRRTSVEPAPLLDGHQLMARFDLSPGPSVGRLLADLRESQAVGEVATLEEAVAWAADRIVRDRAKEKAEVERRRSDG